LQKIEIKRKENLENMKIDKFVPAVLKKYVKGGAKAASNISQIFKEAAGDKIAENTSAVKFEDGKLTVKINDPILKVELKFMEEEIKNSINSNKNIKQPVEKIIFK